MSMKVGIDFRGDWSEFLDESAGPECPRWLSGDRLNIARLCFQGERGREAIVQRDERGHDRTITLGELERLSGRVAGGLKNRGLRPGDAVGILLPMTIEAVAAILGIILAGGVVVGIPESFAPPEIETRLKLGRARWIITQDSIHRRGSKIPLRAKLDACDPLSIITIGNPPEGDIVWADFLGPDEPFEAVARDPSDHAIILFSSGTTGRPKAIPWTHTTPIKCAVDGFLYQDIQLDDLVAWPSSPGWMMGPWLIFATLMNGATIGLFDGHPGSREFCRFVADWGVTTLGVVPSLVAAWRAGGMTDGLDWSEIRRFSSTGECSNPNDMFWLMSRAGYKPVIEYCGGTEIGGGYLTSHPLAPNAPGFFNTVAFGLEMVILDPEGQPADRGEAFLIGPSIGLSTELIDGDHHAVYYEGTPKLPGKGPLRRHGDQVERLPGGFYRVLGRVDDTMNLGGIKVAAVEIERVLNLHPIVRESAAVTEHDPSGGPERLVAYLVLQEGSAPSKDLKAELQALLSKNLNPLFRLGEVAITDALPRTASQKVMRRLLRDRPAPDLPKGGG
ncbi:MAG: AMP-binding protein [Isosphaeraceae bacterium]